MLSDAASVTAAEFLVRAFAHVWGTQRDRDPAGALQAALLGLSPMPTLAAPAGLTQSLPDITDSVQTLVGGSHGPGKTGPWAPVPQFPGFLHRSAPLPSSGCSRCSSRCCPFSWRPDHRSLPPTLTPRTPLTTLLITVVTAVVVPIAVPQAPDAIAVLAGELVLLTLPGGCGHRAVRLRQAQQKAPQNRAVRLLQHCHEGSEAGGPLLGSSNQEGR